VADWSFAIFVVERDPDARCHAETAGALPVLSDADFHVSELAADLAGAMSPFGQDVEFPLPLERLSYEHPIHLPHRAGVPDA